MKRETEACLSDLLLDRLLAEEPLRPDERARAEAHLGSCAACAQRKEELFREYRAFELAPPRPPRRRRPLPRGLRLGLAAAAAAALALVIALPSSEPPGYRTKGAASLVVIARTQDGAIDQVLPGDALAPGDDIRFEVRTSEPAVLAILGIDAAGAVTPYVEELALEAGGPQLMPGAIRLDDTLGPERIVALFCEQPLGRAKLLELGAQALARAGGDPASELRLEAPGCVQTSLLIWKRAQP